MTGHDAYYEKKGDKNNISNYKNSFNFVKAIRAARKYEKSQEKLVIIAGKIFTMPGLPKVPAAESIDINENGEIVGLF